jgi:hypothetical protein
MRGRLVLPFTTVLAHLFIASIAAAQPLPPLGRAELFGRLTFLFPQVDTTLTTSYAPELRFGTVTSSSAGQTLQITGENGVGFEAGAALFFTESAGVQVLFGSDRFDLTGTNGPYTTHLDYISRQPPDNAPRSVVIDNQKDWPDTEGQLKQRDLSFNLVGRWRMGGRAVGQVSGGLTYFRVEGVVSPVGYTVYHLGGHSVLFPEEYELELAVEPSHGWGFNAGGTLDIGLGRHAALTADVRYLGGQSIAAPTTVAQILNQDEIVLLDEIASIQEGLQPPAVEIQPNRLRAGVGIKVRF